MVDDGNAVQERIATAEKRLAALRDHGVDPAALLGQLSFARRHLADGRLADAEAVVDEVLAAARRLAVGGATARQRPPPPSAAPAIEDRLRALADQMQALQNQIAELGQRPAAGDTQVTEAVRTAIAGLAGKLPTREDLEGIAENLRADLDWRLERIAAERGWCSLADVQATIEKMAPESSAPAASGGAGLARLEAALSEFVNQTQRQQDRLLTALKERVEATRSLTRRLPSREASRRFKEVAGESGESGDLLDPLPAQATEPPAGSGETADEAGSGLRPAAATPSSSGRRPATDLLLEPVSEEPATGVHAAAEPTTDRAARFGSFQPVAPPPDPQVESLVESQPESPAAPSSAEGSDTETLSTQVSGLPPAGGEALHDLVVHEVERQLQQSPTAGATVTGPAPQPTDLRLLVAEELARLLPASEALVAAIDERLAGRSDAGSREVLLRLLPDALRLPEVRQALFAVLALEAVDHPSALGELTGLRSFLRRELRLAVEELAARGTPSPAPA